jgi:hypothetical protein
MSLYRDLRTSRVESLNSDVGEPALATCRQILLWGYPVKLSALKKHPSFGAILQPFLQRWFALNPKAICPAADIRFKELLDAFHITTHPIIRCRTANTPPFLICNPYSDSRHCDFPKACSPPGTFRRLCSGTFTHYSEYTVVFTDGSVTNGSTGCRFILNRNTFKFRLNSIS